MKNEDVGREVVSYRDASPYKKSVVANKEELAKIKFGIFCPSNLCQLLCFVLFCKD